MSFASTGSLLNHVLGPESDNVPILVDKQRQNTRKPRQTTRVWTVGDRHDRCVPWKWLLAGSEDGVEEVAFQMHTPTDMVRTRLLWPNLPRGMALAVHRDALEILAQQDAEALEAQCLR